VYENYGEYAELSEQRIFFAKKMLNGCGINLALHI